MPACSFGAWRLAAISAAWHAHTSDAALVLDAAGYDVVIIETVGVGQDEVDIVSAADISIVLLVPGAGDDLQAIKAGVMEIGDIFVVNKADREGADRVVQGVASNLALKTHVPAEWKPPILKTEATTGAGVEALWKEVGRFREWAAQHRQERRRQRHVSRLRDVLASSFLRTSTALSARGVRSLRRGGRQPGPRSILSG